MADADGAANFMRRLRMSHAQLSQLVGRTPIRNIGPRVARRIERACGLAAGWLDHAHSADGLTGITLATEGANVVYVRESRIIFAGSAKPLRFELVRESDAAPYTTQWFNAMGIKPSRARRFRVVGDSMYPYLSAGDVILVNLDERAVIDGQVYAIQWDGEMRVKRLSRRLDGSLILSSDNPSYPPDRVTKAMQKRVEIIGRVREIRKSIT